MGVKIDLSGKRFGRLVAIERCNLKPRKGRKITTGWLCECDCGEKKKVSTNRLTRGVIKSCGCLRKDIARKRMTKHGLSEHRLHFVWRGMKNRCYNKNYHGYHRYGGRGIFVADEWKDDFQAFFDWAISNGYKEELEIDREDNDKGYSSGNCRFVSRTTNVRNGIATKLSLSDACEIRKRLENGEQCKDIAKDYPIANSAISNIKNNVTWVTIK